MKINLNVLEKIQKSTKHRKRYPIEKEIRKVDKDGNEDVITVSYKIKHIDNARSMACSLSNLFDNLSEGIHKVKCKDCNCFLEYESVNDNLIKYRFLSYNKSYSNKIEEKF